MIQKPIFLVILIVIQYFDLVQSALSLLKQVEIHNSLITDVQFSADYSKFVTASGDGKFIIWNTTTLSIIAEKTLTSPINGIGINDVTNEIITLLQNGQVQIYDLTSLILKSSFTYPNSGHGNQISFVSSGTVYMMGGLDQGQAPNLHFFDRNHTYISSMPTTFKVGSEITQIFKVTDGLIFLASNEATAPVGIEMYTYDAGSSGYMLKKKFTESNGKVRGMSISIDGSYFFSVAQDLTLRNYTLSPFDNLFEVTSVVYYNSDPIAVNGVADVVTYVSTSTELIEYFKTGQVSLQSHYPQTSPITQIINFYPRLICMTSDGKMLVFSIAFFDGTDKEMTKWVVLSSVMGGVVLILLLGLVLEVRYNRIKQKMQEEEQENLGQEKELRDLERLP